MNISIDDVWGAAAVAHENGIEPEEFTTEIAKAFSSVWGNASSLRWEKSLEHYHHQLWKRWRAAVNRVLTERTIE